MALTPAGEIKTSLSISDTRLLFTYSPQLIDDAIEIFREEDGILLSKDEAVTALEGLAGLFLAFAGERAATGDQRSVAAPK